MRRVLISALLALAAAAATAQTANYDPTTLKGWQQGMVAIPATPQAFATRTVQLDAMVLANTSTSAVTVQVYDASTNCNGASCQIWPTVTIAANSTQIVNLLGVRATSGAYWIASTAGVVDGWIRGR